MTEFKTKLYKMNVNNIKKLQKYKKERGASMSWTVNKALEEFFIKEGIE